MENTLFRCILYNQLDYFYGSLVTWKYRCISIQSIHLFNGIDPVNEYSNFVRVIVEYDMVAQ
jgi:hypothetical protein